MIRLRPATLADAGSLLAIYAPYVTGSSVTFETEVPSLAAFEERIREITREFPYLVAEEDGVILGYAYAHPYHERAAFHWTVETSIYVRMGMERNKLGTLLYKALLALLKLQGVHTACALITLPNDRSMAFHEKMGFLEGGSLPAVGYKFGNWYGLSYCYCRLQDMEQEPGALIPFPELPSEKIQEILG